MGHGSLAEYWVGMSGWRFSQGYGSWGQWPLNCTHYSGLRGIYRTGDTYYVERCARGQHLPSQKAANVSTALKLQESHRVVSARIDHTPNNTSLFWKAMCLML